MSKEYDFDVNYIEDDAGRVTVIPNEDWIARNIEFIEKQTNTNDTTSKQAIENYRSLRSTGESKVMTFKMRPYTYGERLDANRKSTVVTMGEQRTDAGNMNLLLLETVTGKPKKDLEGLPTPIVQSLFEEMSFLSEPDSDRMLFLLRKRTTGVSRVEPLASQSQAS